MANEHDKDVNTDDQFVADPDVSQPITGEGDTGQLAPDQEGVSPPATDENRVPLSRLNEEIQKKRDAETKNELLQQQLAIMQQQQQLMPQAQTQQPLTTYEQAMKDLGYDADYLTEAERIQVFRRKEQLDNQRFYQQSIEQQNRAFMLSHPDYGEVVGKIDPATRQVVPSAEITEILQRKPWLYNAATASAEGAYNIVIEERRLKELESKSGTLSAADAAQKAAARTAPMSGSAAGGAAGIPGAENVAAMKTAADVAAMEARVAAGEFD